MSECQTRLVSAKTPAYHHGDLRAALLKEAALAIRRDGVFALSLRELSRRAGVSHAAPQHHFGDKTGLLTALAIEGFELFADALSDVWSQTHASPKQRFEQAGLAYVHFALAHPAHFEVMFKPALVHDRDAAYQAARVRALDLLVRAVRESLGPAAAPKVRADVVAMAAWAVVHGFSQLWLDQNLTGLVSKDGTEQLARSVLTLLSEAVLAPSAHFSEQ